MKQLAEMAACRSTVLYSDPQEAQHGDEGGSHADLVDDEVPVLVRVDAVQVVIQLLPHTLHEFQAFAFRSYSFKTHFYMSYLPRSNPAHPLHVSVESSNGVLHPIEVAEASRFSMP